MAYLGTAELEILLPTCIDQFKKERIDNVAYELCLGNEVYLTDSTTGKKEILDAKNSQVVIKPGQFALLLTNETVTIPNDILAFISIKFSQKIKGLVNVSGFHVDPGFVGKIIFSVYNAGPATIVLDKDKPYFMIWFSKLTSSSTPYAGKHKNQQEISAENINALKGELASPNILLERIKSNESLLKNFIWAAGITIGLGITLSVKSFWDSSKFNEGYKVGLKEKQVKEDIDNTIKNYKIDSVVSSKIDSLLNNRTNQNDTTKKSK
jgi:dCTP deaminase